MEVLIIDGAYKGCEATTFTKGGIQYFKDELDGSDILLNNHLYIQKDGCLCDIVYLLNIAYSSENLGSFSKSIVEKKIKAPLILTREEVEKFYSNKIEIEHKFLEILKREKEERAVFSTLMTFVQETEVFKPKKLDYPLEKIEDSNNKYGKIFNSEIPDIDFSEVLKASAKSGKPFVVVFPEDMLSEPSNKYFMIANDAIKKALQDDDCDSVHVVYLKQK